MQVWICTSLEYSRVEVGSLHFTGVAWDADDGDLHDVRTAPDVGAKPGLAKQAKGGSKNRVKFAGAPRGISKARKQTKKSAAKPAAKRK